MKDRMPSLHVAATPAENAAVERAVAWLNARLAEVGWTGQAIQISVGPPLSNRAELATCDIVIVSLLPELDRVDEAWSTTERRLRDHFGSAWRSGAQCCLLTIFRHVGSDQPRGRIARIRRLNLLATDLSRRASLFVIDIDRALADVGSRAYATDERLHGTFAIEAVAHEVAAVFLSAGFLAALPRPAQQALGAALDAWQPPHAAPEQFGRRPVQPTRRRQTEVFESREKQIAHLIQMVMRRRLRIRDALALASATVRRKGLRTSVSMGGQVALRSLKHMATSRFDISLKRSPTPTGTGDRGT